MLHNQSFRIGHGFDVHQLATGRPFILGGVMIPWEKGIVGHSDADVLIHAICDALLGAAALRDIGYHFPDTDDQYKNINSGILLQSVIELMKSHHYAVGNIDCTIALQSPKISQHIPQMQQNIAQLMGVPVTAVSIKATTTEHLGFTGRGEGIAVWAVALLYSSILNTHETDITK